MTEHVYTVSGMTCGHCANAVTAALTGIAGVERVEVDVDTGRVAVTSTEPLAAERVRAAVDEAGYRLVIA